MSALTSEFWTTDGSNLATDISETDSHRYICVIHCKDRKITVTANLPQEFSLDIGASYEEAFSQGLSGLLGGFSETAGKAMKMLGMQLTTKALTAQTWQGSTEVSFSLPMIFQVERNEFTDMEKPLRDLYSLVLPIESEASGLLQAPGPYVDLEKLKKQTLSLNSDRISSSTKSAFGADGTTSLFSGVSGSGSSSLAAAGNLASEIGKGLQSVSGALMASITNNISLTIGRKMHFDSVVITSVSNNTHVLPLESGRFQRAEVTVGFKTFYVLTNRDLANLTDSSIDLSSLR